jgi:hypothetical protein
LEAFSRSLLLVAEHTWGMDIKTYLADFGNYSRERFEAAKEQTNFKMVAASWAEQRDYIAQAVRALGDSSFSEEARSKLSAIEPALLGKAGFEAVEDIDRTFATTHFSLRFDSASGAIAYLFDHAKEKNWADGDHLLGLVRYQTFSEADYRRFLDQYLASWPEWAEPDFSKPGLASADGDSKWWYPSLSRLLWREDEQGQHFLLEMNLPVESNLRCGAPELITLALDLPDREPSLFFDLQWFQKPANRQPEAVWFSFCPLVNQSGNWMMEKMGKWISPLDVIHNGNRKLHAVESGVLSLDGKRRFFIETLDAPLVAPGEPSLLNFNNEQPALVKGWHFNLYNNVWGTNFPMWYGEDGRFRFVIRLG